MKYRILAFAIIISVLFTFNGCVVKMYEEYKKENKEKFNETTLTVEETVSQTKKTASFLGMIDEVDMENKLVNVRNLETDELVSYSYTGATDVRDKYGKIMTIALVEPGYIVDCEYRTEDNCMTKISASNEGWENLRVHNWKYSAEENYLKIGNQYYDLYDYKIVSAEGSQIDIRELSEVDELIVRGRENKVYSISVLKGHGYISLRNEAYFIGGIITVGNEAGFEVTDDMLIMAGEGKHILSISKNGVGGSVEVEVKRNKEIVVDVGEFQGELKEYGSISFKINPEGARLYINGRQKLYDELVELAFGTYKIAVEAEGCVPYIGDLVVGSTFMRKTISLGLQDVKEEETTAPTDGGKESTDETTTTAESGTGGENETSVSETTSSAATATDVQKESTGIEETMPEPETTVIYTGAGDVSKYKINIDTPTGAEAYFDSEYIGTVPVSIPKQSGIHTIIFKKEGYKTKAYTIEISAEAQDEYFSFIAMQTE